MNISMDTLDSMWESITFKYMRSDLVYQDNRYNSYLLFCSLSINPEKQIVASESAFRVLIVRALTVDNFSSCLRRNSLGFWKISLLGKIRSTLAASPSPAANGKRRKKTLQSNDFIGLGFCCTGVFLRTPVYIVMAITYPCFWNLFLDLHHEDGQETFREQCCFYGKRNIWGFSKFLSLDKLHDKRGGFLVNNRLVIIVEVKVLPATVSPMGPRFNIVVASVPQETCNDVLDQKIQFEVLASQTPRHCCGVPCKEPTCEERVYELPAQGNRDVCQPLEELSNEDLVEADIALTYLKDAGFKVDWLEKKLNQLEDNKEKEKSGLAMISAQGNRDVCQPLEELSNEDLVEADIALTYLKDAGFKVDWLEKKLNQLKDNKEKEKSDSPVRVIELVLLMVYQNFGYHICGETSLPLGPFTIRSIDRSVNTWDPWLSKPYSPKVDWLEKKLNQLKDNKEKEKSANYATAKIKITLIFFDFPKTTPLKTSHQEPPMSLENEVSFTHADAVDLLMLFLGAEEIVSRGLGLKHGI
ncbi:unnamed protein product [Thlaspi arvense]|uniref:MATH domain-containing protein n=1 Tax=Thlaspi arvense TaxID=13288 RepID=A0AAU9RRM7_THLAR|nr:unnamed protein product [Thlaspi arvense]